MGAAFLVRVLVDGFCEEVTLGKSIPGREKSKLKGLEVGTSLVCLKIGQHAWRVTNKESGSRWRPRGSQVSGLVGHG